ncbi:mechanosensitive ion channel protein MscS [Rhodoferax koreense]|uniref:Mechanosensitive ion channel protein MscS n=1 Tax=Rhodoferax koreensis TaxID=1842727 RepID=A0A1P8K2G8_9BURK|nr:mechanosensitive ion channel domain-containing protein [Rhodoferax koreense]APW40199.1 mechanosensitive ion channel protein MscS [Rhodoferax koreense]
MHNFDWVNWADESASRILIAAAVAVLLSLVLHRAGTIVLRRLTRSSPVASAVVEQCRSPAQFLLPLVALQAVWQAAPDTFPMIGGIRHTSGLLLLAALTWLGVRAVRGAARGVMSRYPVTVEDNLNARRIQTQTQLLARTAMFIVLLAGLALMLMTFPGARQFGASLLASAGVVGLVAGIAARPVFSNLIAGLQIALAQPIRLDDVLIVQGEWGRVEEITGTYVVLAIWDQRRLIIPLQWFIENPFQNWTRKSAEIIGTVFMWVDYRMPLAPLREAALAACQASRHWDGRLCLLQVVEAGERAMQLRWLVTSASSGQSWDLRCEVREAMVDFVQREYPQYLPQLRAEVSGNPGDIRPPPAPV